jgi:hypothetical protein
MKHTPGAIKASKIIMNDRKLIRTDYGDKTEEGLADLIDNETAAPEMLDELLMVIPTLQEIIKRDPENFAAKLNLKRIQSVV